MNLRRSYDNVICFHMFGSRCVVMLGLSGGENVRLLIFWSVRGARGIDVEVSRAENRKTSVINDTAMSELTLFHRTIILFLHNACRYQHAFYTLPTSLLRLLCRF
jgi:hypothetical protein